LSGLITAWMSEKGLMSYTTHTRHKIWTWASSTVKTAHISIYMITHNVSHNTTEYRSDNLPSCLPENRHSSNVA